MEAFLTKREEMNRRSVGFLLTMLLLVSSGVSVPAANAVENEGGGKQFLLNRNRMTTA